MTEPTPTVGHNTGGIAAERLRSIVERIERLESERQEVADQIKDIYIDSKSAGYDVKVLRQLIRLRKDPAAADEQEQLLHTYMHALGM